MNEPKKSIINPEPRIDNSVSVEPPVTSDAIDAVVDKAVAKVVKIVKRNQFEFFKLIVSLVVKNKSKVGRKALYLGILSVIPKLLRFWFHDTILCPPGSRKFRRRYLHASVIYSQDYLKQFRDLSLVSPELFQNLRRPVSHAINRIAILHAWAGATSRYFTFKLLPLCTVVASPLIIRHWFHPDLSWWEWATIFLCSILLSILAIIVFFLVPLIYAIAQQKSNFSNVVFSFGLPLGILVCYELAVHTSFSHTHEIATFLLLSFFGSGISTVATTFISVYITSVIHNRMKNRCPEAVMINILLSIVIALEKKPNKWYMLQFRKGLIEQLEEISAFSDYHLLRILSSKDPNTDAWLRNQTAMIANHFRAMKKWLLTPKADTSGNFRAQIFSDLCLVAGGEWDAIIKLPIDNVSRHDINKRTITAVMKTLLTGILISLLGWVLHTIPFLHIPLTATLFGLAYILLAVINLLDPNIAARIDIAKHLRDIMPEIGERKP